LFRSSDFKIIFKKFMSIRIHIGNLPQGFNPKELDTLLKSVSDSIRFKAVLD